MSFKDINKEPVKVEKPKYSEYENLKNFTTSDVINSCNKGLRLVKVAGVPIGVASSDEDEREMMKLLHRFKSKIRTAGDAMKAGMNMQLELNTAEEMIDANVIPTKEFMINGEKVYEINGNLYDRSGEKIND